MVLSLPWGIVSLGAGNSFPALYLGELGNPGLLYFPNSCCPPSIIMLPGSKRSGALSPSTVTRRKQSGGKVEEEPLCKIIMILML